MLQEKHQRQWFVIVGALLLTLLSFVHAGASEPSTPILHRPGDSGSLILPVKNYQDGASASFAAMEGVEVEVAPNPYFIIKPGSSLGPETIAVGQTKSFEILYEIASGAPDGPLEVALSVKAQTKNLIPLPPGTLDTSVTFKIDATKPTTQIRDHAGRPLLPGTTTNTTFVTITAEDPMVNGVASGLDRIVAEPLDRQIAGATVPAGGVVSFSTRIPASPDTIPPGAYQIQVYDRVGNALVQRPFIVDQTTPIARVQGLAQFGAGPPPTAYFNGFPSLSYPGCDGNQGQLPVVVGDRVGIALTDDVELKNFRLTDNLGPTVLDLDSLDGRRQDAFSSLAESHYTIDFCDQAGNCIDDTLLVDYAPRDDAPTAAFFQAGEQWRTALAGRVFSSWGLCYVKLLPAITDFFFPASSAVIDQAVSTVDTQFSPTNVSSFTPNTPFDFQMNFVQNGEYLLFERDLLGVISQAPILISINAPNSYFVSTPPRPFFGASGNLTLALQGQEDIPFTVVYEGVQVEGRTTVVPTTKIVPPITPVQLITVHPGSNLGFKLHTTGVSAGPTQVSIGYSTAALTEEQAASIRMYHFPPGGPVDVTVFVDTQTRIVTGSIPTLDPVALLVPAPTSAFTAVSSLLVDGQPAVELNSNSAAVNVREIGISDAEVASGLAGLSASDGLASAGSVFALGPRGAAFLPAAKLQLRYSTSALSAAGMAESSLGLYRSLDAFQTIEELPHSAVDPSRASVNAEIYSFPSGATTYVAILGKGSDMTPPRTELAFQGPHFKDDAGLDFVSTRTAVSLAAEDRAPFGSVASGVGVRSFSVDSSSAFSQSPVAFSLSTEGFRTVRFFSSDRVGNIEGVQIATVAVDRTPPTSSLSIAGPKVVEPSRVIVGPQTLFSLSSEDPISNGVSAGTAAVAALLDETAESCGLSLDELPVIVPGALPGSCGNPLYSEPFAVPAGTHVLRHFGVDNVLNAGVLESTTVIGDYTLPSIVHDAIPPFTNNPQPSFRATFSDFLAGLNVSSLTISLDGNLLTEPAVTGTTLTWRTGTSLGTPVYANSLVHSGGVLYSLGGVTSAGYLTTVSYNRLTSGGVPGGWTGTTSLPEASGFMGAAALDGRIYAVGNQPGSRRVIYAQTTSNGLESQWHNGPDLPAFLFNAPLVAMAGTDRYLFVIAGQNDSNTPQKTVYRSVIDSNGVPTGWTAVTPFPDFVTAHAAASFGGRIYVLGGLSDAQSQTTPRVWSASVTANGILGQWQREPDLPIGISGVRGTVALTASGRLYAAGGYDDRTGQYKADVWSSKPSSTGVLEAWQQETSLPEPLGFHGGAAGPVGLYIAGGATGSGATGAVRFATVAPPEGFVGTAEISASTTVTLAAELHTVVFQGADRVGNVRTSTVQFMLDLVPPTLALTVGGVPLPAGESRMVGAPLPEIVAAASDNSSGVNAASLRLFVNSASVGTPGTSDIRFTPETLSPGLNTLEARVSDNAGNAVVVTASLFFDPSPPEVALLAPLSGSVFGAGPVALEAVLRDDISGVATGSVVLSVGTTAYAATLVGGSESSSLTWRNGPSLLKAVYANSLVHSGGVIYNLGGVDSSGYLKDVTFNVLEPDGTPTQWQSTTLLPDDSGFMGAAALGGRIYAVGNQPGSRRVIYAQASSNGLEPEWHNGPLLPSPLFNAPLVAMAATGRFLFVIAGQDASNTPQSAVYRSIVDPSGTMSSWEPVNRFPVTVTAHAAASLNGRIYVLGGLSDAQSQTTPRVWSVAVDTGGNLGIWQEEPELPIGTDGVRGTVALTASGRLYALGGYDDRTGQYKAEVWSSKPEAGGGLEAWRQETSLPQPLGFHGGAAGPKGIYIAGGVVGGSGTSAVRYAQVGDGSLRATALAAGLPQATYEARASAADMAGNVTFASVAFHVDLTGPETLLVVQGASSTAPGLVLTPVASTLTLTARDLPETNNAGWAATYLAVNGAPPGPAPASFSLSTGTSLLEFWSVDTLGNVGSTQTLLVTLQDAEVVAAAVDGTAGISAPQAVVISTLAREEAPGVYQLSADSQGLVSVFNSYYELTDDIVFPLNDRAVLSFYLDLSVVTVDTTTLRIFTFEDASQTWISTSILNQRFTLLSENFGVFTGELEHTSAYALMRRTIQTDAVAPAVAFAFPRTDESGLCRLAQGPVTVRGSASDENLSSWRLTQGASLLGSGTADVQGTLGTWDATGLSGPYTLTLSAQDSAGNTATASLAVQAGPPARTLALGGKQVLSKPRGVVAGPNRIYVADTNTDAVRVFDAAGVALAVLGDKKGAAKLNKPAGIALDAAGNILVADANNKRVVKLSPAGMFVAEYGKGVLQKPVAVALSAGRLVVADAKAGQLIVFSDAGALLARVDLPQAAGPDEDPEEPRPVALAADAAGNVWAADAKGRRVLRYTPELTLAQTIPGFQRPEGVAVSPSGSCLAVSDSKAARIRTFDASLSAGLAAFGVHGEIKENKALPAEFLLNKPAQLAFDAQGTLLVADRNNDLVQGFGLPGTPVVVAMGTPGRSGGGTRLASADGGSGDVVASARVGRFEGGRVEHPDGAAVEVPAGAISADLDVAVAKAPDSGDGHRVREAARGSAGLAAASGAREFSPHGLSFSEPAVITLPYDPLLAAAPRELKIHYWNEERGAWEALASTIDEGARTVSARVAHFSVYQVLAPVGSIGVMADPDAGFAFRASYAFPNPAVGGQRPTVHVAVGRADKVVVRFYDVAGTPVHEATLDAPVVVNDESGPHLAYEYAWTGHIPSGVYLYSVTAEKAGHAPIKRLGKLAVVR